MPDATNTSETTDPRLSKASIDELIEEIGRRADVVVIELGPEEKKEGP